MSAGSVIAAMTRTVPPQRGQRLRSIANTGALSVASNSSVPWVWSYGIVRGTVPIIRRRR